MPRAGPAATATAPCQANGASQANECSHGAAALDDEHAETAADNTVSEAFAIFEQLVRQVVHSDW